MSSGKPSSVRALDIVRDGEDSRLAEGRGPTSAAPNENPHTPIIGRAQDPHPLRGQRRRSASPSRAPQGHARRDQKTRSTVARDFHAPANRDRRLGAQRDRGVVAGSRAGRSVVRRLRWSTSTASPVKGSGWVGVTRRCCSPTAGFAIKTSKSGVGPVLARDARCDAERMLVKSRCEHTLPLRGRRHEHRARERRLLLAKDQNELVRAQYAVAPERDRAQSAERRVLDGELESSTSDSKIVSASSYRALGFLR